MPIRHCTLDDAQAICDIYNYYIKQTVITFEEALVDAEQIRERIRCYSENYPWLVLENRQGEVQGYAYASKWAQRSAFRHTAEVSVYLHHQAYGQGYGRALYEALLNELTKSQVHIVMAVIALPNEASVKLQESFGFKKVAHLEEVGRKFERWIDVGYWQLALTNC